MSAKRSQFPGRATTLVLAALSLLLAACAPLVIGLQDVREEPRLEKSAVVASDGSMLPLRVWRAGKPRAMLLALHGFNDYSNAFAMPGPWLADRGITVYAYDQRGFGQAPNTGIWPGSEALVTDLRMVAALLKERHPRLPLYVLGTSMGGAVAMTALTGPGLPEVEGVVLVAPAVWGWRAMNPLYKSALWLAAHTVPFLSATGEGLGIKPSDNVEMLRALGRDPLVIKDTRIDAVYGLVGLMDQAYEAAPQIRQPVLYLYGANDELVPRRPTLDVVRRLAGPTRFVEYVDGWHMLLRDLQRQVVWRDIASWLRHPARPLPSGQEAPVAAAAAE